MKGLGIKTKGDLRNLAPLVGALIPIRSEEVFTSLKVDFIGVEKDIISETLQFNHVKK